MNRKRVTAVALAGTLICSPVFSIADGIIAYAADTRFNGEEWYDQIETVEINREPAHATFTPYESVEQALSAEQTVFDDVDETSSPYYQTLNGDWSFKFAQRPADREKQVFGGEKTAAYEENWDTTGWDTIKVPSTIQAQRDENGDFKYEKPLYVNQIYPWANYETVNYNTNGTNKPVAPTVNNSIGQYKRTFTIPEDWDGRQVFVSFQGVESAFYLYINGQRVGYAEDSYTVDEFNITDYLQPGENTIAAEVYRWSTGSYLENQDFIRLSGIFRDVYLYSKNDVELRDFFVTTDLDDTYTDAVLNLEASVRSLDPGVSGTYTVEAQLYGQNDEKAIWDTPLSFNVNVEAGKATVEERADDKGQTASGSKEVTAPKLWFADDPNLYRLTIQLKDPEGNVVETTCQRIGFREISKVDINEAGQEQAQINGKKLMIRGANRQEIDLYAGRAITRDTILEDLKMMKAYNVNAVRTSHYPNNPFTYAAADELGLYICDEANLESHRGATEAGIPSAEPAWTNSTLDRTMNMVERDKNHASVIIWSLGNEATYQTYEMNENYPLYVDSLWILERDPSRLRKYERDNRYTKGSREDSMVDIYSSQYWSVSSVESHVANTANKAPYIQSEYSHAMGNGVGNFKEYWDIFRTYENAQGGFIWDWIDQSIATPIRNTTVYYVKNPDGTASQVSGSFAEGRDADDQALDGKVFIPADDSLNANSEELTLAAWVKMDGMTGADQAIISKGDSGYNLKISRSGNQIEFFVDGWSAGTLTAAFPEDKIGEWVYLVGTYADGQYTLYLDGGQIAQRSISKTAPLDDSSYQIGIGDDPEYNGRNFNGLIDGVQVLKKAMTADEVRQAYEAGSYDGSDSVVYEMNFTADETVSESTDYEEGIYFGYGGDWGETVTDHDFCGNGLVNADRTPSAELAEVKKVHQEVSFYDDGEAKNGQVRIVNEFLATNLQKYNISWRLLIDNGVFAKGTLTEDQKNIEPGAEATVTLEDFPVVENAAEGTDYLLEFSVTLKEDQNWAGEYSGHKGDEIAYEQFELDYDSVVPRPAIEVSEDASITAEDADDTYTVTGTDEGNAFSVTFDKSTGYITNYTVNGDTLLTEGPKPNYFRARVSNDPNFTEEMKNAADNFAVEEFTVDAKDKVVTVHAAGTITTLDSPQSIDYTIYANGDIVVTNQFTPADNTAVGDIARIGMKMTVPQQYQDVTYYGRGPEENYIDRNTGSLIGVYHSTVEKLSEAAKYTRPQEHGNRTDVRWTALTDGAAGKGIMVAAADTMEMSALHYDAAEINRVYNSYGHPYQVEKTEDTILTVDYAQRGLGNASCGPGPLAEYILNRGETYTHTFRITPIMEESKDASAFVSARMENSKQNPDSTMPVSDIKIDGVSLSGFEPARTEYTYQLLNRENLVLPEVTAVATDEQTEVTVTQADADNDYTAAVTAASVYGIEKTYTIKFEIKDAIYVSDMEWLVDKSGYSANMRDLCTCGLELGVWVDGVQTPFEKGVGSHAPSEVTFNVDGMNATKFTAVAGIGMEQGGNSNVNFIVKVDGEEVWRQDAVTFKTSVPVEIDITGAKTVSLMTETNGADSNDHAVWADAKIFNDAEPVDVTALREELDAYAKLEPNATDYAKNSWDAYAAAASDGQDKINSADQAEINAAAAAMKAARETLVSLTGLKEEYEKYSAYDPSVYTEESFRAMKTALADAEKVLADPAASKDDVTAAIDALTAAESQLVTVTKDCRDKLFALVQAADNKNQEDYTASSWADYKACTEEARSMVNDPNATAEKMQKMIDDLTAAEKALVNIVELRDAVAGYADKDQVNYTTDSWKPVEDVRVLMGKAADASQKVTQEEVDAALEALKNADLVDVSELKQIVAEAEKAQEEDYEEAAWNTLQDLLKKTKEEVLVSGTAKQVQTAVQDLKAALEDVKEEPEDPDKPDPLPPEEIPGTGTGDSGNGQPGAGNGNAGGSDKDKAVKTGDMANVMPYAAAMIFAGAAAAVAVRRKRS
ncbi:MAG: NPCBM/NEW2 domain-containing protein [Lachnospiraceae bacterium]|nr:NPCBM/NEW2 domain-containing protein [Lachnospiraceae bacterium]